MTAHPTPQVKKSWRADTLTLVVAALLASAYNLSFWRSVLAAEPTQGIGHLAFLAALWIVLATTTAMMLSLVAWRGVQKPALAAVLLVASIAAFFMDNYGAVVDRHALQSVLETDAREGGAWLSLKMIGYLLVLGVIPSIAIALVPVSYRPWPKELLARVLFMVAMALVLSLAVVSFSRNMASLARNHRELRHLATPFNIFNAVRGHLKYAGISGPVEVAPLGTDARLGRPAVADGKPVLMVIVIGESARASSFSLNGYPRDTNPGLAAIKPLSFTDVESCGTNTATSLPCMFSNLGRERFSQAKAKSTENLLDVIARGGYTVEWLDNNTGSKDIAARLKEVDVAGLDVPGICDKSGCNDQILVEQLKAELATSPTDKSASGKVLVLHMIGSHGPAYYERYPPAFERFKPTCRQNTLQDCSRQEIINSYDNTIAYSDHVLAQLIGLLKEQQQPQQQQQQPQRS